MEAPTGERRRREDRGAAYAEGWGVGMGYPLPSRLGGLGKRRELPQRQAAGSGAEPRPQTLLKHILGSQNGSGTGRKCDILPNVKQNFVIFLAWYRHFLTA